MADLTTSDELLLRFDAPTGNLALIVEDDGRVAYAYLLKNERIVSDVWLYNVAPAPDIPPWHNMQQTPFLNPVGYCKPGTMPRLTKQSVIQCKWRSDAVEVVVDGIPWAHLESGAKPAWSLWAMREGPLARPLQHQ